MVKLGPWRERGGRTCQVCVRSNRILFASIVISRTLQSYEHGINTFDTANIYSNGLSEVYLGRAIKTLNLPREEIVVMTKVCGIPSLSIRLREPMS